MRNQIITGLIAVFLLAFSLLTAVKKGRLPSQVLKDAVMTGFVPNQSD